MGTRVIMLNGGSSSGKSTIARRLQDVLPDPWLTLGVDTLVDMLPPSLLEGGVGIDLAAGSGVAVGEGFREAERAWIVGVAAMARAGARVVVDEVFLGGSESRARWRGPLEGLEVLWVGVRCDPDVAAAREAARGDRVTGMARSQAALVHAGMTYDVEVDTARSSPLECARLIAAHAR
ncbi:chloramphenicol phosphotransferase CPT [Oryzihumus leptocrescens]|uniref:Chloramphenicol 3-O phosphotransferase n=1 Tax=Oryzihumus leptocrescens TaxID=297536 RepID=A0A542ZNS9_9MICO|nr:chloramphenicol phosphotransferase CPT [Oryzihumus leptocrescens]TQL61995.1 chloramphenicol 3-O phosphotransferase [Oryzihumus leptocrescens]